MCFLMAAYSSKFIFWDPVIFLAILNIFVYFCPYVVLRWILLMHLNVFATMHIIFPCKPYNMIAKHYSVDLKGTSMAKWSCR